MNSVHHNSAAPAPTRWPPIDKPAALRGQANLTDYRRACTEFDWDTAAGELSTLPGGAVNIAHEAVDRHLNTPRAAAPALHWLRPPAGGSP